VEIWLAVSFPESYDSPRANWSPSSPTTDPPGPFQGFTGNFKTVNSPAESQQNGLSQIREH